MYSLYIRQKVFKFLDHYPVTDAEGVPLYHVDQEFRWVRSTFHVTRADGEPVFMIQRDFPTWLPRFRVSFDHGREYTLRSRFSFMRKKIDIEPEEEGLEIRGDLWDHHFTVTRFGRPIGSIHKTWLSWGDVYELEIHDAHYEALFIAIVIAVDAIKDAERSNA